MEAVGSPDIRLRRNSLAVVNRQGELVTGNVQASPDQQLHTRLSVFADVNSVDQ